ncbi:MAG: FGGY-family carbohydrate kinase [Sphaerochaeta sp.]|nr:FGGY-family carbohydrate kinase [Sphaerochaeta sp.]
MQKYLLGLDNGGTLIKAVIYDLLGNEVAVAKGKTESIISEPGYSERDMDVLWKANCRAVKEVLKVSGIEASSICAMAVTGQGNGLYLVDGDGNPCRNGISSADRRSQGYVDRWNADGTDQAVKSRTFQTVWSGQPVAILAWLQEHENETLEKTKWIFMCKDYIRYRLTGEAWAEITDYSGTNLVNLHSLEYDDEILLAFDLADMRDRLPPLKKSTDCCGAITAFAAQETGLLAGTPVYGGLFDIDASAIGLGMTRSNMLAIIAGTWSINEYISQKPVTGKSLKCTAYCMDGYYLITESSPTSASNLEWVVNNLHLDFPEEGSPFAYCDQVVEQVAPDSSDVLFLPFLYGSNVDPHASGTFLGLSGWHTIDHMIRAVFEGIVFSHRMHIDRLRKDGEAFSVARLAGGVGSSRVWVQMFSDILQMPLEIMENKEVGVLGAAMAAGVGAGLFSSFSSAAEHMVRVKEKYYPRVGLAAVYDHKYERYCKAINALNNFWIVC